ARGSRGGGGGRGRARQAIPPGAACRRWRSGSRRLAPDPSTAEAPRGGAPAVAAPVGGGTGGPRQDLSQLADREQSLRRALPERRGQQVQYTASFGSARGLRGRSTPDVGRRSLWARPAARGSGSVGRDRKG